MREYSPAPVLSTELSVDYVRRPGVLKHVDLDVLEGEILGLVGESGSGKSTFAMAVLRLLPSSEASVSGSIVIAGREITSLPERDLRTIRGRIASLIPQNPLTALNPALSIKKQLKEAWSVHAPDWSGLGMQRARSLFVSAGLDPMDEFLNRRPHQVSVGQAQRIMIAMALLHDPKLVIADEPTSALDLVTQREVLRLLAGVSAGSRKGIVFISHDIPAVANLCHRVAILHDGMIVESGAPADVLRRPNHPYTRSLVNAVPEWCTP